MLRCHPPYCLFGQEGPVLPVVLDALAICEVIIAAACTHPLL